MSKKFIIFTLAAFTLLINLVLAYHFTTPVEKSVTQADLPSIKGIYDISLKEITTENQNTTDIKEEENIVKGEEKNEKILSDIKPLIEEKSAITNEENVEKAIVAENQNKKEKTEEILLSKNEEEKIIENESNTNKEDAIHETEDQKLENIQVVAEVKKEEKVEEKIAEKKPNLKMLVETITLNYTDKVLSLRIKANQKVKARTLYVGNPERALLDLEGKWLLPSLPAFPENPYSSAIRTGYQETATRFVLDISTKNFTRKLVQIDPQTVELRVIFQ